MCELNNCFYLISYYDYFNKLLLLENVQLFSRQDKILGILVTTILILYRKTACKYCIDYCLEYWVKKIQYPDSSCYIVKPYYIFRNCAKRINVPQINKTYVTIFGRNSN